MIKKHVLFILILFWSSWVFGQQDYYSTDTLTSIGAQIINSGFLKNFQQCEIKTDSGIVIFTPAKVKEYGMGGRIYVSHKIDTGDTIKDVFLNRLVEGDINFYYYREKGVKKFFLEKDSLPFIEVINKDSSGRKGLFHNILKENATGCKNISEPVRLVRYTKSSLSKFIQVYNKCDDRPFPFVKVGIITGIESTSIIQDEKLPELLKNATLTNDNHFLFGIFLDHPILQSPLSFHPEIFYQRNNFSYHNVTTTAILDAVVYSHTLNFPVLFRYTFPWKRVRPFFEAGPSYVYNLIDHSKIYSVDISGNVIELDNSRTENKSIISTNQLGYSFGGGIQFRINYKKSLYLSVRENKYGGTNSTAGINKVQIFTGLNF